MSRPTKKAAKPKTLAELAVAALEDVKGQDIKVIDVMKLTAITDTMIVCTGTSSRHVKSLADRVIQDAKDAGYRPMGVEGLEQGEWVLVDLGGVVVHVMQPQARAFYQLEKLWDVQPLPPAEAPRPVRGKAPTKARKGTAARKAGKAASKAGKVKAAAGGKKPVARKAAASKGAVKKGSARKSAVKKKTAR